MSKKNLEGLLGSTLDNLKSMVDSDTIMGKPIFTPDGVTIIPIAKSVCGFSAGGSDLPARLHNDKVVGKDSFGGIGVAGVSMSPVGFLVISNGQVQKIQIEPYVSSIDRVIEAIPDVVSKINDLFSSPKRTGKDIKNNVDDDTISGDK